MVRLRLPTLLALVALLMAVTALLVALRRSPPTPGRLLQLAPTRSYTVRSPIPYTLDDFQLMKLDDGSFVALYIYPPGMFGHTQGCTIRWEPTATFQGTLYPRGFPAGTPPVPPTGGIPVSAT